METKEWATQLDSGEELRLPAPDNKRSDGGGWKLHTTRTDLSLGQLTIVKSNYSHRLIGEGKIAMLYLSPDSVEGQSLLVREDYHLGLAITTPPKSEMSNVLRQLSLLYGKRWSGASEAATEVYNKIAEKVVPAANPPQPVPDWLISVTRGVRNRCRLKRYQCELNARIRLRDLVCYIRRTTRNLKKVTPKRLEEIFREHLLTRVCHYVRFLHHAAAMQYYAAEQYRAAQEHRDVNISMTELAVEVHYLDPSQFTRDFHGFHGITPVMFFPNTTFYLIDMKAN